MQKFQCLQPKSQCGKFQAPSRVPEEGERSLGPKMLVPGFPDLGRPARGGGVVRAHGSILRGRNPGSEGLLTHIPSLPLHQVEKKIQKDLSS